MTIPKVQLRKHQKEILKYQGGYMGIIAVPGSGKTFTLSHLAANLISEGKISDTQEILVVTLVNSAVDNFYQRVGSLIKDAGLMPNLGYRVRTLHGLAHDIIRERPDLAGLDAQFAIIDERDSIAIIDDCINGWLKVNSNAFEDYLNRDLTESRLGFVKQETLPVYLRTLAVNFIRYAKDHRLTAEYLKSRLQKLPLPLYLAEFGSSIFETYQRSLAYRGVVDFDDLIKNSLHVLQSDQSLLKNLRNRWPYILEDEAQDSSHLQEEILALLAGPKGNWVRAGDPNQAIFETFTTANPKYLRDFCLRNDVIAATLPTSSRSTKSIINLANLMVEWTQLEHPVSEVRDSLQPPYIEPVESGDRSPNPSDDPQKIHFVERKLTPQEEVELIAKSISKWLPENQDKTIAVLAPRNQRADDLVDELKKRNIPFVDSLLKSSAATRTSAGAIAIILRYLSDPQSSKKLAGVFNVWRRNEREDPDLVKRNSEIAEKIRKITRLENFLFAEIHEFWQDEFLQSEINQDTFDILTDFCSLIVRWQSAVILPIDQLVLTIAQDIFSLPSELALAYKLAALLRQARLINPSWRLSELTDELTVIAKNERRFIGFSEDDLGFNVEKHKGQVVVATMHKAKGLEWDRVYLMSINNYDFPSGSSYDEYISEKWFFRDRLNIESEALAQLDVLTNGSDYASWYLERAATEQARLDYIRERLRLLYVGITRAKKELILTWNTGRKGQAKPAIPFINLHRYWKNYLERIS